VIEAVGWNRAMNEGFRIHTTIDSDLQKAAEDSLRSHLDGAEKHPDYEHPTVRGIHRDVPQGSDREAARRRCPTICRAR
jgi:membrane carboxypeptidase/penicillin-binding protein